MGSAEVQGELWGRDPQTWANFQEPQMRPLYDATLDALEPLAGRALLDAGCGAGLALRLRGRPGRGRVGAGRVRAAARGGARPHPAGGPAHRRHPGAALRRRQLLEADRKPDGELRQDNVFRYVVATKGD